MKNTEIKVEESLHGKKKWKYIFMKTIPVLCGYMFVGISFGIMLQDAGYNWLWAFFISLVVYAGSMQFVMVPMMISMVSPITMAVTTLFINSRHIFYGLSFVDSFKKIKAKPYMISSLTDETYSVLCSCKTEDPEEKHRDCWLGISALNHLYWIIGSVLGACLGEALPFDLTGIDFAMTALFVVILLDQIVEKPQKAVLAAMIGLISGIACLWLFGSSKFLLPALLITAFILSGISIGESKKEKKGTVSDDKLN